MNACRYPKPAAFPDLDTRHWVLEASAGTGKTYTLEHLVVDLVLEGDLPLEQIAIVTYTEAASLELRRRIREKLQELRDLSEDRFEPGRNHWEIDDRARLKLDAALQAFDRTVISTIHAFCQKILQDAAFETGRPFRQQRADDQELFADTFREHLRTTFCATQADRDFLAEALDAAGSPEALLNLLRKAWGSHARLLPGEADLACALQAVRDFPLTDLEQPLALLEAYGKRSFTAASERFATLRHILETLRFNPSLRAWIALGNHELFSDLTDKAWGQAVWSEHLPEGPAARIRAGLQALKAARPTKEALIIHRLLPSLAEAIQARKEAEGLFDFNDMIDQVAKGLENPGLVARLQDRYKAALIDEFQDTDARQWGIFQKLFAGPGHRLVLVGDPKQAIYDFRGGDLPTYLKARDHLLGLGGKRLALDRNFRSSAALIGAVNEVLEASGGFFSPPNEYPEPVSAGRAACLRGADGELPPLQLLRVPVDGPVGRIRNRLAAGIATSFRRLLEREAQFDAGTGEPARPLHAGDLMVLTHTTRESKLMAKALRRAGLPSMFFKADGLFQTREAFELKDLLAAILHPDDPDARGKALLTRFFGFGLREAEACLDLPADHPVLTRLERWQELARQRRYPRLFNAILEESGVVRRLLLTEQGDRALTNLRHLIEHLLAEATASHPDLEDLLLRLGRWIREEDLPASSEDAGTQRAEGQAKAVRILTIHKAKGLESPVVALFGGYSLRPPQAGEGQRFHDAAGARCLFLGSPAAMPAEMRAWAEAEAAQETERKLYVAITRPKVQLVLPVFEAGAEPPPRVPTAFDAEGHPKGAYGPLNRRLRTLLEQQPEAWGAWALPLPKASQAECEGEPLALPARIDHLPQQAQPDFAGLARRGRPLWIHSFTSLSRALSRAFTETAGTGPQEEEGRADEAAAPPPPKPENGPPRSGLPGGAATGSALHELLERLPPGRITAQPAAAWREEQLPLAAACLENQGLDPSLAPEALQLARLALSTEIGLPGGSSVLLDGVPKRLAEVGFQMPFPGHPDALEGSIDLLFEWEGRTYILDWKSNSLEEGDYGQAALDRTMAGHYDLQVRIYTLAALALLGIHDEADFQRRFGGAVYVFLRGLPAGGIWTRRPAWEEVQAWRRELSGLRIDELALNRMERGMHG